MSGNDPQTSSKDVAKIILAFAAIYIIWGTTYLGIRIALETMPPFLMAGMRFLMAGAIMFLFLLARGAPWPQRLQWRSAVIIGGLLLGGGSGLVTWSEQQVPSGTAALVIATVPLWIALFDWLFFKGLRPGRRVTMGIILGFAGIAILVGPGQLSGTAGFELIFLLVLLLSPILWSLGSLYSRGANLPEDTFMATAMEMLAGGALLLAAGLLTGEAGRFNVSQFSTVSLAAFAYLTVLGSIIAFTAYIWLLKVVAATKVSTYTYVNPVIAVFLGWLIVNEPITATIIAAVIVIVLAVILITTAEPGEQSAIELSPPSSSPKSTVKR